MKQHRESIAITSNKKRGKVFFFKRNFRLSFNNHSSHSLIHSPDVPCDLCCGLSTTKVYSIYRSNTFLKIGNVLSIFEKKKILFVVNVKYKKYREKLKIHETYSSSFGYRKRTRQTNYRQNRTTKSVGGCSKLNQALRNTSFILASRLENLKKKVSK